MRGFLSRIVTGQAVAAGYRFPRGYGLSYYRWYDDVGVYHPIPLNLLIRGALALYRWVSSPYARKELQDAYQAGYRAAKDSAQAKREWEETKKKAREQAVESGFHAGRVSKDLLNSTNPDGPEHNAP